MGVLIFFTEYGKDNTLDAACTSPAAVPYLDALGAAVVSLVTVASSREACFGYRFSETRRRWRLLAHLVRSGMLTKYFMEQLAFEEEQRSSWSPTWARESKAMIWLADYFSKWKGSNGKPAPPGNWANFGWTFGGVALSLLLISGLNQKIVQASDTYFLLVGSLGALNTLMYAIPNAPLVQPRNIIGGHLVSCAVAVLWMYVTNPAYLAIVPQWVTCALAPATAIALMGKLGLTHPPAGAACLIYVSAPYDSKVAALGWMYLLLPVLASALITMLMGIAWNNLCNKRQYPIYW